MQFATLIGDFMRRGKLTDVKIGDYFYDGKIVWEVQSRQKRNKFTLIDPKTGWKWWTYRGILTQLERRTTCPNCYPTPTYNCYVCRGFGFIALGKEKDWVDLNPAAAIKFDRKIRRINRQRKTDKQTS